MHDHRPPDRARPDPLRRASRTWPGAGATAPVDGQRPTAPAYDVSLAWTGADARPHGGRDLRPRHGPADFAAVPGRGRATSRSRRRTWSTPTSTATSATRRPGQIPIRQSATPGAPPGYWPAPGWKSRYDWKGYVPFAQMPYVVRPAGGVHRHRQPGGAAPAGRRSSPPTGTTATGRSGSATCSRPRTRLTAGDDVADPARRPQRLRADAGPAAAATIKTTTRSPARPRTCCADWDFTQPTGRSEGRGGRLLQRGVAQPAAPDLRRRAHRRPPGRRRRPVVRRSWATCCRSKTDPWWDNKATPGVIESRDEILRQALVAARLELTQRARQGPARLAVGPPAPADAAAHGARRRRRAGAGPRPVQPRARRDMPGGSAIVDATGWDARQGYAVNGAVDADGRRPRSDLDRSPGSTRPAPPATRSPRTTTTRSTPGSRARPTPGRSPSRRSARPRRRSCGSCRTAPTPEAAGPAGVAQRPAAPGPAVGSRSIPRPGVTTASTRTSCPSAGSGPGTSSSSPTTATTRAPGARRRSARS